MSQGSQSLHPSCKGDAGSLWESLQGIRGTIYIEGGNLEVFLEVAAGISLGSLEVAMGTSGASHVVSGKSGILLHCDRCLRFSLQLVQGNSTSSEVGTSGVPPV